MVIKCEHLIYLFPLRQNETGTIRKREILIVVLCENVQGSSPNCRIDRQHQESPHNLRPGDLLPKRYRYSMSEIIPKSGQCLVENIIRSHYPCPRLHDVAIIGGAHVMPSVLSGHHAVPAARIHKDLIGLISGRGRYRGFPHHPPGLLFRYQSTPREDRLQNFLPAY